MTTTIAFVHKGRSWFLPHAAQQAKLASPESDVVLIGSHPLRQQVGFSGMSSLENAESRRFRRCYVHRSTLSANFELFCWLRWFYLLEYLRRTKKDFVLYLDSDVLLYSAVGEMDLLSDGYDCGFCIPELTGPYYDASAHVSFWTRQSLEDFCAFILRSFCDEKYNAVYQQKWEWHLRENVGGGVCDMSTFYLFWRENQPRVRNLAMARNGTVFEHNINIATNYRIGEYRLSGGHKEITITDRRPFLTPVDQTVGPVRAHALHFQGAAKPMMKQFCFSETPLNTLPARPIPPLRELLAIGVRRLQKLRS